MGEAYASGIIKSRHWVQGVPRDTPDLGGVNFLSSIRRG